MGKFYRTVQKDELAGDRVASGLFDSICGDRSVSVGTYREFVVYDADQLYPEFIIIYSRNFKDSLEGTLQSFNPFHMELPIYWSNCVCDPRKQVFNDQFMLERTMLKMLQR